MDALHSPLIRALGPITDQYINMFRGHLIHTNCCTCLLLFFSSLVSNGTKDLKSSERSPNKVTLIMLAFTFSLVMD